MISRMRCSSRRSRFSFLLFVAVSGQVIGSDQNGGGRHPDRDPEHFRLVLVAADSAYLRDWAHFHALGAIRQRLRVDPRPATFGNRWQGPNYDGLTESPTAEARRQAIRDLGVEEATDVDFDCVRFRWGPEHEEQSRARQRACLALGRVWVYSSTSTRAGETVGGTPLWSTKFYGTRAGSGAVHVEVLSFRRGETWEVEAVRMIRGVLPPMLVPSAGGTAAEIRNASAGP
jgi:hypothetical protein